MESVNEETAKSLETSFAVSYCMGYRQCKEKKGTIVFVDVIHKLLIIKKYKIFTRSIQYRLRQALMECHVFMSRRHSCRYWYSFQIST